MELVRDLAAERGVPLATLLGEVLHVLILDALFSLPESEGVALQGGTCLHLVHGGYRYSEDLDLTGERLDAVLAATLVERARPEVERLTVQVLGPGPVEWKGSRQSEAKVGTYWFHYLPAGSERKVRVKLDFARYPAYTPVPAAISSELDLLRRRPLVNVLGLEELLAEKLAAALGRPGG